MYTDQCSNLDAQRTFHQLALHLQSDVRVSSILQAQDKHINILLQTFYENLINIPIKIYKTILYALVLAKR